MATTTINYVSPTEHFPPSDFSFIGIFISNNEQDTATAMEATMSQLSPFAVFSMAIKKIQSSIIANRIRSSKSTYAENMKQLVTYPRDVRSLNADYIIINDFVATALDLMENQFSIYQNRHNEIIKTSLEDIKTMLIPITPEDGSIDNLSIHTDTNRKLISYVLEPAFQSMVTIMNHCYLSIKAANKKQSKDNTAIRLSNANLVVACSLQKIVLQMMIDVSDLTDIMINNLPALKKTATISELHNAHVDGFEVISSIYIATFRDLYLLFNGLTKIMKA